MGALPWVGAGDVSSARDLSYMFAGAEAFNQDVSACTSSVVVCSGPHPPIRVLFVASFSCAACSIRPCRATPRHAMYDRADQSRPARRLCTAASCAHAGLTWPVWAAQGTRRASPTCTQCSSTPQSSTRGYRCVRAFANGALQQLSATHPQQPLLVGKEYHAAFFIPQCFPPLPPDKQARKDARARASCSASKRGCTVASAVS